MKKKLLTTKSGHVKELSSKDISAMRSASDVLPKTLLSILPARKRGERGLQKEPKKTPVTVRYSNEVINYFKSTGNGWQVRMNDVLQGYVKRNTRHSSGTKTIQPRLTKSHKSAKKKSA